MKVGMRSWWVVAEPCWRLWTMFEILVVVDSALILWQRWRENHVHGEKEEINTPLRARSRAYNSSCGPGG